MRIKATPCDYEEECFGGSDENKCGTEVISSQNNFNRKEDKIKFLFFHLY